MATEYTGKLPPVTGSTEPKNIICPDGHNMYVTGYGTGKLKAVCYTQGCTHYRVNYEVASMPVQLIRINETGE